jgi:RNA polymerase sigma factor (sigma-70 family)
MTQSLAPPQSSKASEGTFERLYRLHRGDVYRFVLRDVRNAADAEDITQTTFMNAFRALQHGDEPEKPRAWLLTIAQNVSRRRFRTKTSRPLEVELDSELLAAPESDAPSGAEIRQALQRLRPNQRAVLVLREIGGLSYAEIAETLGLSLSAVETLIFRSRRALREELAAGEERALVKVGGITLWPLPVALSGAAGKLAGWFGSRTVAAKVAGAVGAAVIGTSVAVETGAVGLPGALAAKETPKVGAVTPGQLSQTQAPGSGAAATTGANAKKASTPTHPSGAPGSAGASQGQGANAVLDGPLGGTGIPGVTLPEVLSGVSVPPGSGPPVSVPPVTIPPVTLPPVTPPPAAPETPALPSLPPVPNVEAPPLPDVAPPPLPNVAPPPLPNVAPPPLPNVAPPPLPNVELPPLPDLP